MSNKKLTTEKRFSKEVIKFNKQAIETYKTYQRTVDELEAVKVALGKKKVFRTQNNSTLNSKVNLNAVKSTQSFQVNTGLA